MSTNVNVVDGFESAVATVAFVDLAGFSAITDVYRVPLYSIELAPAFDPAWIDPVCKMHAPYEAYHRTTPTGPWFCSERCAEAYRRSPELAGRLHWTEEPLDGIRWAGALH